MYAGAWLSLRSLCLARRASIEHSAIVSADAHAAVSFHRKMLCELRFAIFQGRQREVVIWPCERMYVRLRGGMYTQDSIQVSAV